MVPVAVNVCCSLALASEAPVSAVTANRVAADVSTDRCPVVASNLTGECGELSSDEGCCVGTAPVMSVSAVEDGWRVLETVPSSAVAVPACSSAS